MWTIVILDETNETHVYNSVLVFESRSTGIYMEFHPSTVKSGRDTALVEFTRGCTVLVKRS